MQKNYWLPRASSIRLSGWKVVLPLGKKELTRICAKHLAGTVGEDDGCRAARNQFWNKIYDILGGIERRIESDAERKAFLGFAQSWQGAQIQRSGKSSSISTENCSVCTSKWTRTFRIDARHWSHWRREDDGEYKPKQIPGRFPALALLLCDEGKIVPAILCNLSRSTETFLEPLIETWTLPEFNAPTITIAQKNPTASNKSCLTKCAKLANFCVTTRNSALCSRRCTANRVSRNIDHGHLTTAGAHSPSQNPPLPHQIECLQKVMEESFCFAHGTRCMKTYMRDRSSQSFSWR